LGCLFGRKINDKSAEEMKMEEIKETRGEEKKLEPAPIYPTLCGYCSLCSGGRLKFSNPQGASLVEKMQKSTPISPMLTST
jgi:hypothetical protein